jgi:hypothetical protein
MEFGHECRHLVRFGLRVRRHCVTGGFQRVIQTGNLICKRFEVCRDFRSYCIQCCINCVSHFLHVLFESFKPSIDREEFRVVRAFVSVKTFSIVFNRLLFPPEPSLAPGHYVVQRNTNQITAFPFAKERRSLHRRNIPGAHQPRAERRSVAFRLRRLLFSHTHANGRRFDNLFSAVFPV